MTIRRLVFGVSSLVLFATQARALDIQPFYAQQYITQFYQAALFREPDTGGLKTYMDIVAHDGFGGLVTAAAAIGSSSEANALTLKVDTENIVRAYYHILLKREPDADGFANWVKACRPGACATMLKSFVLSEEYIHHTIKPGS